MVRYGTYHGTITEQDDTVRRTRNEERILRYCGTLAVRDGTETLSQRWFNTPLNTTIPKNDQMLYYDQKSMVQTRNERAPLIIPTICNNINMSVLLDNNTSH